MTAGQIYWLTGSSGSAVYYYNNVITNSDTSGATVVIGTIDHGPGSLKLVQYNNTTVFDKAGATFAGCSPTEVSRGCTFINNHFIGQNAKASISACILQSGCSQSTNVAETISDANRHGYSAGSTYPWQPTLVTGGTVNSGTDISSLCSKLTGLCTSSTVGVGYNTTNHTVIAPNKPPATRPGKPDIGAYQYSGN